MNALRRLCRSALATLSDRAPASAREWSRAMLTESDQIANDIRAISWMLGCTLVITRRVASQAVTMAIPRVNGRTMLALVLGLVGAGMVIVVSMTIHDALTNATWFAWQRMLSMPLFFVGIPEVVFVGGIAMLWRRQRSAAIGVVAVATMLLTHAAVHMLSR